MASEPPYETHSALYGATGGIAVGARNLTSAHQGSRSFFIIDKSRMVGERDTVEGAKVVYLPEAEFEKVSNTCTSATCITELEGSHDKYHTPIHVHNRCAYTQLSFTNHYNMHTYHMCTY